MFPRRALCLFLTLSAACDDDASAPPPPVDAGPTLDASADAGGDVDAGAPAPLDAALPASDDAAHDAGDAGDAAATDGATDSAVDASTADAGSLDCSTLGLTYDNYGAQYIYLWCLSCHAKTEPHLDTPEQVQLWLPAIYSESVASKRMPPGGNANYLRDPQREEFGRWLDCGAP